MADIHCAVCGEPWDAYGVQHGDMLPWEAALFRKGAGCPCCQGQAPEGVEPEAMRLRQARDIIINDAWDDPHAFDSVNRPEATPPKWERPEDPVVFTCECCAGQVRRNLDETTPTLYWQGGKFGQMYNLPDAWDECLRDLVVKEKVVSRAPSKWTLNDRFVCPGCAEHCGECGEYTASEEMTLPEGRYHDALCSSCFESESLAEEGGVY